MNIESWVAVFSLFPSWSG